MCKITYILGLFADIKWITGFNRIYGTDIDTSIPGRIYFGDLI